MAINNIGIFAGALCGKEIYHEATIKLAQELVQHKTTLVYGGASVGLMGMVANHMLINNMKVIGIIPKNLAQKEIANDQVTELHITAHIHERKALIYQYSDAFIALPGGLGTADELFEVMSWNQMKMHQKLVGVYNVNGYYNHLKELINKMIEEGFLKKEFAQYIFFSDNPKEIMQFFHNSTI
jgi:uncharacterized protein (TIGR00730 family)